MRRNQLSNHPNQILDHNSPIPLHYQLSKIIRQELVNGNLIDQNGKMLTEAELTEKYNVSRITVRNALKPLVEEGILWRERGKGTFLKTNRAEKWHGSLMGLSETMETSGFNMKGKIIKQHMIDNLSKTLKERLQTTRAWELKRVRFADDQPIAIEKSLFIPDIGLALSEQDDLDNIVAYKFIEQSLKIPLHQATQVISAVNANQDEADLLNVSKSDALIHTERLTKSVDGRPVELLEAVFRPDFFQYIIHLKR